MHLNYKAHPMIRAVYHFHVYYHVRRVLKRLQVPLPHETGFDVADNAYTKSEFLKICEDYRVPNFPIKYQDEKFYWTYQRGVHWPNDYIAPDSMTWWILEASDGFTDAGLYKIPESVRAYAYLILSSQASARSSIVENTAIALTAQSAFLDNFENVVNRRVDIREDIKHYQDTLSYASSKVDYSIGENVYMLPSNMNLKIRSGTAGYNNKILVSDGKFILGKNEKVNALETPAIKSHKDSNVVKQTADSEKTADLERKLTIYTHEEEKIALILSLTGIFMIWYLFQ